MKILLIRHGETTGDLEDRYGGFYDDHLTERGRQQLTETAEKLKGVEVDIIFSSSLVRAQESAEIVNTVLNTHIEIQDGLRERNYGILGGLTKTEAKNLYPEAVELHKDYTNTDQDGESWNDFNFRVIQTFESIVRQQQLQTIVILGHGGSIKAILRHQNLPSPPSIGDGEIIEITATL